MFCFIWNQHILLIIVHSIFVEITMFVCKKY
nr:MAG TPA: hypothetical protein [Bacteriophage sp.]